MNDKKLSYAAKLADPRWLEFRDEFIQRKTPMDEKPKCYSCDNKNHLNVHHRRYIRGLEPWEYEDEDLVLICHECHEQIHTVAHEFYSWMISIPPHQINEAKDLLAELLKCKSPAVAMAHCKNAVRNLNH